ncbi:MAG: hypothetical protein A4E35_02054 [Methanoregula sp. PtaU1.Bin051]|nr:MAG: hypothetical protein A4E35_02054 [Methanoregula sp. PtaU1.Bin051]
MHCHNVIIPLIAALILCCCIAPVSAVLLEVTCKGTVTTEDTVKNTLSIKNPEQYGCDYPTTGVPQCSWKPVSSTSTLTGTVPDPAAFSILSGGDLAVATSLGGLGEQWITLAKIYGPRETEQVITDIVGDPSTVPLPLVGDYAVETEMVPDCSACTGTVCTAKQATVTVKSSGSAVLTKTLARGETLTYNGRNDGSRVMVKFISGQAASQACPGKSGMTGPQAVSVFIVKITPPVGYGQVNIRTATTTRPDEALTPLPTTPPTPSPEPTKSGTLVPFTAFGALAVAALVLMRWSY